MGNTGIILMVIALVTCVLAIACAGTYFLNKMADENAN
jgi:hypothetical protein